MNHLREEHGLDVFFVVEHINAREDGGILESGEALLVSGSNIRGGRQSGGRGRRTEIRDVLRGRAVARSPYGG